MLRFKLTYLAATTLLVFGLTAGTAVAQNGASRGTGLETDGGINVVVENIPEDAKEFGLRRDMIINKTELTLRRSNVKILEKDAVAYLYVRVTLTKLKNSGMGVFGIFISVNRPVRYRVKKKFYDRYAKTWSKSRVGFCRERSFIMDSLEQLLNAFLNEYLAANG